MLFAQFDDQGKVTGLTETPVEGARKVSLKDPEVLKFLAVSTDGEFDPDTFLDESDKGTIRILEDLIDTLVSQHLIRFTDLPMPAQKKLLGRKFARTLVRENSDATEASQDDQSDSGFLADEDEPLF